MAKQERNSHHRVIAVLLALILCGVLSALHRYSERNSKSDTVTGTVRDTALTPIQTATVRIGHFFKINVVSLFNGRRLSIENENLKKQIVQLTYDNKQLSDARDENVRLRALLDFQKKSNVPLLPAEVIALKPTPPQDTLILNRGLNDHIRQRSIVIGPNGSLVGQVVSVGSRSCTVQLITDSFSGVGIQVINGDEAPPVGICRGKGGGVVELTDMRGDANVKPGDKVVTSGLGGIYPAGIPLGEISSAHTDKNRSIRIASVKLSTDFDHLDTAFILPNNTQ